MSECEDCLQLMKERDMYEEKADELAQAIADHFELDIGEHSSANNPLENAIYCISPSFPLKTEYGFWCGQCGKNIEKWKYCPNCGQKLDWSE